MMSQIIKIIEIFGAEITSTEYFCQKGENSIFLDFENEFCWASISYNKDTKDLSSAAIEDKGRKFYFQLNIPGSVYETDPEALLLDSYDDYLEKSKLIWENKLT